MLPTIEQPPNPATFILNQNPRLAPLADNGGPTRTHLPDPNSPVIDAGFPFPPPAAQACEPMDQRGVPRLICDMGAVEREVVVPTSLTVNTTADEADVLPGNGICETASHTCSLRAAVQEANRLPGTQTIMVPAGVYTLSIPADDESGIDPAAGGDLDLRDSVNIIGASRSSVVVDGNGLSRVFDVFLSNPVTIRSLTIRNGNDVSGGGIQTSGGSLTLDNVIVENNRSSSSGGGIEVAGLDTVLEVHHSIIRNNSAPTISGTGGGISGGGRITVTGSRIVGNQAVSGGGISASGPVTIIESTIANNRAMGSSLLSNGGGISATGLNLVASTVSGNTSDAQGGGIFAVGSIVNSTISGNTSQTNGGGVSTNGTLSLLNVTIARNQAMGGGNGLHRFGLDSQLALQNTILADPGGSECAGLPVASRGNNIASDTSCVLTASGDRPATNARLAGLVDNGGLTLTHMPNAGSPAIDAAANVGLSIDQRGAARPIGPRPDIGAVEAGALSGTPGDVNGNGRVTCSDLAIVRAAFGTRQGQAGFDARADVVRDGVIDILDLAFVADRIPRGTVCSQ